MNGRTDVSVIYHIQGVPKTDPLITSAEEGGYVFSLVCLSVRLSVRRITRKLVNGF